MDRFFVRARYYKSMKKMKNREPHSLEGWFCTESFCLKMPYANSMLFSAATHTNPSQSFNFFLLSFSKDSIMYSATTGILPNLCECVCTCVRVSQHLHNAMFTLWGHLLQLILPPFMDTKKSSVNQKAPNTHRPVCLQPPSAAQKKHRGR